MGFLDGQAGQYNLTATSDNKQTIGHPPAGVSVTNAHHIHFERNIITQMGATGLDLVSGTHDDVVIGNVITKVAGNGISIGKFVASETTEYHTPYNPADKNEICTNDTIKDNYIHHVTTVSGRGGDRGRLPEAGRHRAQRGGVHRIHRHLGRVRLDQHRERHEQQQDQLQ